MRQNKGQLHLETFVMSTIALILFVLTVAVLFRNTNQLDVLLEFTQGDIFVTMLANRLVSNSDCLAYEKLDYNIDSFGELTEYRRVYPGIVDFNKFKNWDSSVINLQSRFHAFQCMSYFVERNAVLFPSGEVKDYSASLVIKVKIFNANTREVYTLQSGTCTLLSCPTYKVILPVQIKMPDGSFHYGLMHVTIEFNWEQGVLQEGSG